MALCLFITKSSPSLGGGLGKWAIYMAASLLFDTGPKGAELEGQQADKELKGAYTRREALSGAQAKVAMEVVVMVQIVPLVLALCYSLRPVPPLGGAQKRSVVCEYSGESSKPPLELYCMSKSNKKRISRSCLSPAVPTLPRATLSCQRAVHNEISSLVVG